MKRKTTLIIVLVLAVAGMIFSGYLSYYTLWGPGCTHAIVSCGTKPIKILGLPQCIYGFFMYTIVALLAIIALAKQELKALLKSILVVSIVGVGFSGFLSVYELFVYDTGISGLPACVYGFFVYVAILIFSIVGLKAAATPYNPTLPNQTV